MRKKSQTTLVPAKTSPASCVAKEEITKASQTAQLLRSDLGSAYKNAADPLLQIVLLRLMKLASELQSELLQVEAAMDERK